MLSDTVMLACDSSGFLFVSGVLLVELSELGDDGGFSKGECQLLSDGVDLDPVAGDNL